MKRFFLTLLLVGIGYLTYYFIFKPFEFEISFRAKTTPGDLIETLRIWNRSIKGDVKVDSFSQVVQNLEINSNDYLFYWDFKVINDSLTNVRVKISQPTNRLRNKLLVPIIKTEIESDSEEIINSFYQIVKTHLEITNLNIVGKAILPETFCVCAALQTNQIDKANGMMHSYPLLTSFIDQHGLKASGSPMIRVTYWSHNLDQLKFEFCFPIEKPDSLPIVHSVYYKKFTQIETLKAEYTGNYITSDRAWYALQQYASSSKIEILNTPIEYFHDNPNLGLNETNWRADIYVPILQK